jgi:phage terminase small subunit
MKKEKELTVKQERFCLGYFKNGGNAVQAYKTAYNAENMQYNTISGRAFELLQDGKITAYIDKLRDEARKATLITKDKVLNELSYIAFADFTKYFKGNKGTMEMKDFKSLTDEQTKAIKGIKLLRNGKVVVELHDKILAIEKLNKMLGYDMPIKTDITSNGKDLEKKITIEVINSKEQVKKEDI